MNKKDLEAISQIVNSAMEENKKYLKDEMDAFGQKMLDRMFLFEQEYGQKIDAIFDVAVMQKDKVQEMHQTQEKFRVQVDHLDTKVFDLDQRVFKLEHR